jgi:hypothetical protein
VLVVRSGGQKCEVDSAEFEDELKKLQVGDFVDALSPEGLWQPATVRNINEDFTVSVVFDNFPSDYEIRVPRDSSHLSWVCQDLI